MMPLTTSGEVDVRIGAVSRWRIVWDAALIFAGIWLIQYGYLRHLLPGIVAHPAVAVIIAVAMALVLRWRHMKREARFDPHQ